MATNSLNRSDLIVTPYFILITLNLVIFIGIILSGNEISQIMLSLILSYIGGQRNRPRWIAWGIVFCGLSCYILVLPHFIYGAGHEVLQFTKEYQDSLLNGTTGSDHSFQVGYLRHHQVRSQFNILFIFRISAQ